MLSTPTVAAAAAVCLPGCIGITNDTAAVAAECDADLHFGVPYFPSPRPSRVWYPLSFLPPALTVGPRTRTPMRSQALTEKGFLAQTR